MPSHYRLRIGEEAIAAKAVEGGGMVERIKIVAQHGLGAPVSRRSVDAAERGDSEASGDEFAGEQDLLRPRKPIGLTPSGIVEHHHDSHRVRRDEITQRRAQRGRLAIRSRLRLWIKIGHDHRRPCRCGFVSRGQGDRGGGHRQNRVGEEGGEGAGA